MAAVGLATVPRAQSSAARPQQPADTPTFRANVNAVQVDLRVVDHNDHFVDDLKKDEFRVFENGQEQAVTTFALINIPIESPDAPDRPRVEADFASNVHQEGRVYVIVLDDLEDQVNPLRAPTVRALAREFIEKHLADVDRAALITTSGRRDMSQEFTNNRQRLVDAANKYEGGYGQTITTRRSTGTGFGAPGGDAVSDNLHSTMLSLTSLARWLAQIDGRRKGIVLVSERLGRSMTGGIDLTLASDEAYDARDFVQAAARGNVSLYIIDPVGVPSGKANGIKPITPNGFDDPSAFDNDRMQSLVTLAEATGGFSAVHTNDYTAAFERIVAENSSYYLLGYASTNPNRDGKFRDINVRTTRGGLRVQARSGYVAAKDTPIKPATNPKGLPPALGELLRSPLPVSGLVLSVSAPPFHGVGSTASVAIIVEAGANQLQFSGNGDRFNANMTLAITAADTTGKVQAGERGALALRLSPGTHDAMLDRGARVVSKLSLKPGRYHLNVAALDATQGTTRGSVLYDLDVPDFSKGPLTISGIALASMLEAPVPTVGTDPRWKQALGVFPTTEREFTTFNELREYVEVYDNDTGRAHAIEVTSTVRNETGGTIFTHRDTLTRELGSAGKDKTVTHRVVTPIPLNDFARGRYVLTVEAHSTSAPAQSVSREIPFSVR